MNEEAKVIIDGKTRRQRVEVIAIKDNSILAYSGGVNSYTELPGGGVNVGENIYEAGLRELAEEAGWLVINPKVISSNSPVFVEDENSWLKQHGYDEEITNYLVCEAVEFSPNTDYGSEGDAHPYTLMHIEKIRAETIRDSLNSTDKRGKFIAKRRLEVIDQIFGRAQTVTVESLPSWIKW